MGHEHSARGNVELDGHPAVVAARHRLAMVYGGGGVFGIAYACGVAEGLAEAGVPVAGAPALGTSAGSWAAAAVALGLTFEDFSEVHAPAVPNMRPGVLSQVGRRLFGEATHDLVSASAVCLSSGRRHLLDGGCYPLADVVAASSAVPGLLPPHRVAGRWYVDGGMWSATSVDAAADADHVIVVAPLAGAVLGPVGRTAGLLLERELRHWKARHPAATITLIRPNRAMAKLAGLHPLSLFDEARAREVYPLAVDQGVRRGELLARRPHAEPGPAA
jgi:NTE family protein